MSVHIFYGSSTGTAEGAANAMYDVFAGTGSVEVHDMMDGEIDALDPADFHVFSCATYGDGELPAGTTEFFEDLVDAAPDLTGLRFAVFGLGDSIYVDTYNQGGKTVVKHLTDLGAVQVGERFEHDNSGTDDVNEKALEWAKGIVGLI
ncbi:Flavodoxin/nitric oxide synthase OS=Tsukamurella paurometabola (strain ATCC 8368 / DSM / CCUG 35730 / CIP 100753 / JCM 10117 / KCTC 9821 / NBRC 16120 /NCIMB 702349 / NCTC 13040) OX=521096 GN=Tpau_2284 PE=4 SV=1 [Tsukamurella paurometabola]|uniref:Flavodoxin/nitric oxide synthase n=1 Tax=Tsukamurella paurometabola (strain ATCC 8368 / DSM 20162 / CCUG 35730 / CIP 100753 / JCM 10117 / KCTC 9821 / NBRC 16120 / NCIMB 702349 / NCTC 13040) TaxID=521096 RepID=D5UQC1_TSUPD|nr:flavodoxin domain-containing protein [Tsukamurella paurometabola]ADG78891.1 flavodoxin/nitric oxide synthase [Tsukamurella paurometabola DSM 20162]SUP33434.1 Sulfite reductase [NADPH] flavoprotein alpha-component [Tsukamurella paurometabola]